MVRTPRRLRFLGVCLTVALAQGSVADGQLTAPPTALPLNSALREDATPSEERLFNLPSLEEKRPRAAAASVALAPIESRTVSQILVAPPQAITPRSTPIFVEEPAVEGPVFPLDEPPPAPPFSWRPTSIPPGAKSGIVQALISRKTLIPRLGDDDGFGVSSITQGVTLAVPPFYYGSPILVTPSVAAHFTDGPGPAPVPPRLFDVELQFRYMKQATPRLGIDVAVAPSYFGDGDNDSSEAYRVVGHAIAAYELRPKLQLVVGALYLGREDWPAVPVGGVIWKRSDEWRYELVVPRPRIYYRPFVNGDVQHWTFLGGEFGGNTWAVDRPGDIADKLTYSDLRLVVGYERFKTQGGNLRFEAGWVFNRSIEFESGFPGFDPSDSFMVRGESRF